MTDEERKENEETPETPVETEAEAPVEEPVAEEAPAEVAEEPVAEEPAEPAEVLSPKERRARERSAHTGEAADQRTPEERQAAREAERRHKASRRSAHRTKSRAKQAERRAAAPPAEEVPDLHPDVPKGRRKERQGVVTSDKANKTITVRIDVTRRHRFYGKVIRSSTTLHAHDESNEAGIGDTVRVVESRPLSRTKRWRLVEVLERAR
jgi:small subunit ribosomal protein S17